MILEKNVKTVLFIPWLLVHPFKRNSVTATRT